MPRQKILKQAQELESAVSDMRYAMEKVSEAAPEKQVELTSFQKRYPNVQYLKPTVEIPTQGKKHPKMEEQREYLTEYVVGIFESQMIQGKLEFFLTGLPGDPYCKWTIPVNKQVGVPRFVAQHLEKGLGWKEMKPLGRDNPPDTYYEEEMMTPFSRFEYKKRGHFHPINSY